jgi:hypothetical protein
LPTTTPTGSTFPTLKSGGRVPGRGWRAAHRGSGHDPGGVARGHGGGCLLVQQAGSQRPPAAAVVGRAGDPTRDRSKFKDSVGRSSLDRFDALVADLNRWEKLRYGGFPAGMPTTMVFIVRPGPRKTRSAEPQDKYVLVLEDIDELFTVMVAATNINPTFLGERHRLKPDLRAWYAKDNLHPMADVFRTDPPAGH